MTHRPRRPIEGPTNDTPYTGPVSADPSVGQNFHWPTDAENWPAREILYTWLRAEWIAHQCVTSRYRAIETMICDTRKMSRSEVEAYIVANAGCVRQEEQPDV